MVKINTDNSSRSYDRSRCDDDSHNNYDDDDDEDDEDIALAQENPGGLSFIFN